MLDLLLYTRIVSLSDDIKQQNQSPNTPPLIKEADLSLIISSKLCEQQQEPQRYQKPILHSHGSDKLYSLEGKSK